MASSIPSRPVSLAQNEHSGSLDGSMTFEEAMANTDGLKVITLEKPMIVHKEPGFVSIGDLPAVNNLTDVLKKKTQFLDVIMGYEGPIDFKSLEQLFLQQRYADLPDPIRNKGRVEVAYNMQLVIVPCDDSKHHIIKHVKFVDGTKVLHSTILSMCSGQALEIDYQGRYRDGGRAFQYMLENMGGFQVRYQKLVPAGASNKVPKETEDIRRGFHFIKDHGPEDNAQGEFTIWTEEQVNDPSGPLYRWERGVIKEYLRCLADAGSQANTIRDWPLTLKSFTPWALNDVIMPLLPFLKEHAVIYIGRSQVGKSPLSYTLSSLISAYWLFQEGKTDTPPMFQTCSHLDYFRKEKGRKTKPRVFDDGNLNLEHPASVKAVTEVSGLDRKTIARWNASSYEKNQLCQICSNPYHKQIEPAMVLNTPSDFVPFQTFFNIVRPSFHKDFNDEDLMGIFKRSVVVVFTQVAIYIRLPGTQTDPVKRLAWPEGDVGMVSPCARPTYDAFLKGELVAQPSSFNDDLQWSLNLLQAAFDKEPVDTAFTVRGREMSTGRTFVKERRPTLAGISGDTVYYLHEAADLESAGPQTKKLKSVRSSSALLGTEKVEDANLKSDSSLSAPPAPAPSSHAAPGHGLVKKEPQETTPSAFKQAFGKRVLQLNISSGSETAAPAELPKPSPKDEASDSEKAVLAESSKSSSKDEMDVDEEFPYNLSQELEEEFEKCDDAGDE
ncbi:unnamed protein product [Symbiodinium sp. CCMP2592]|nr:unnamed protein product [Symbiodinium sp. CCMP2592]